MLLLWILKEEPVLMKMEIQSSLSSFNISDNNLVLLLCRCQDYILIDRGVGGTTEICGNTTGELQLESGEFNVFFRSNDNNNDHQGFEMLIICFQPSEADLEGTFDKVLHCD